jgi:hypothetical protein
MKIEFHEIGEAIPMVYLGDLAQGTGFLFNDDIYMKGNADLAREHSNAFLSLKMASGSIASITAEQLVTPLYLDIEWSLASDRGWSSPSEYLRCVYKEGQCNREPIRRILQKEATYLKHSSIAVGSCYVDFKSDLFMKTDHHNSAGYEESMNLKHGGLLVNTEADLVPVDLTVRWERMAVKSSE